MDCQSSFSDIPGPHRLIHKGDAVNFHLAPRTKFHYV